MIAAHRYPTEFDWRYMTISSLVYPDRDPNGYAWAWAGIVLCALGGLCWTVAMARAGSALATPRPAGLRSLAGGYLCMVCCALLPDRMLPISRGHEALAIIAFLGICTGLVQLAFRTARQSRWLKRSGLPGSARLHAGLLAGTALLPILLGGIAQAYVNYARPELPWVGIAWRARAVPVCLSFAFWEWTSCAVLTLYTALLAAAGTGGAQATRYGFT